jgi:preprotein translocase subunit SecF
MFSFAEFGNDLYTGKRSYDFVGRRRLWYGIAAGLVLFSVLALVVRGGLNPGIEFRGGSEFRVSQVAEPSEATAVDALGGIIPAGESPRISVVGGDSIRVQTTALDTEETVRAATALAEAFDVPAENVTSSSVGPSWGRDVSSKALTALLVFLVLVSIVIALYFRTWKMAVAALVALLHDLIITVGVYAAIGFEVTPASVIGLLTILGYSLYDTVVVFDKVRENTEHITATTRRTYAEAANLAVNQTLVRSINTSVVALLPVASILFIGAVLLGAGTLKDLALALFVGLAVGAYSSICIATPLLVHLRQNEPELKAQAERVRRRRQNEAAAGGASASAGDGDRPESPVPVGGASAMAGSATDDQTRPASGGQRQQPKRGTRGRPGGRRR